MRTKVLLSVLVLFSLLASCNMPASQTPVAQPPENKPVSADPNALATAVEATAIARVTAIAGSAVPATPTSTAIPTATSTSTTVAVSGPCSPLITANVIANVRSGPDTAYDVVGSLSVGQTATIVGRNDAYTWWYIDYAGIAGNHAWVSGSVVTASCVPAVVQVVAASPLSTATVVEASDNGNQGGNNLIPLQPINPNVLSAFRPDLTIVSMDVLSTALVGASQNVKVRVKNTGSSDAGSFTVQWWAGAELGCSWSVDSLAAGASKTLSCSSYKYPNAGEYTVKAVADSGDTVKEKNENNNTSQEIVQVAKLIPLPLKTKLPLQFP